VVNEKANLKSKPSYKLYVKANGFSNILCEVYLPRRMSGNIEIYLYPNKDIPNFPWKFSLRGEIRDLKGNLDTVIESGTLYLKNDSTKHWGKDIKDRVVTCEPADIKITKNLSRPSKSADVVNGYFVIDPPQVLSGIKRLILCSSGQVQSQIIQEFSATIEPEVKLDFDQQFLYEHGQFGSVSSIAELIARFSVTPETFSKITGFNEIDDLMLLLSLAYRKRCMSLGWVANHVDKIETFYRQNMTKPDVPVGYCFLEMLIERNYWVEFLDVAYKKMKSMDEKSIGYLRAAVNGLLNYEKLHFEASYQVLYSGLEALCNLFRVSHIAKSAGKSVQSRACAMARHYNVDLNDLWPIGGKDQKGTLSYIRSVKPVLSSVERTRFLDSAALRSK